MEWNTVVPVVLGGLLAIGGSLIGQWRAERRAVARESRERDHEREVWARSLRYEAHVEFLKMFDEKYRIVQSAKDAPGDEPAEPGDDFLVPVWDRYQAVRMVCTAETAAAAEKAVEALMDYTFQGGEWQMVDFLSDRYLGTIRDEFNLPPIPLMGD